MLKPVKKLSINVIHHKARKRFGQNFIQDEYIINQIVNQINPQANDNLIEIGPGLGAITLPILNLVKQLTVIEIDRDLANNLAAKNLAKLQVISADALKFNFAALTNNSKLRIIGNLPYNISTPLLFHLLEFKPIIKDMFFLLQQELVARICAPPNNKIYGRLSVIIQAQCEVEYLLPVANTAFNPAPKVQSALIRISPKLYNPPTTLNLVVKTAFSHRRKTLLNNLCQLTDKATLASAPVDLTLRAENLSVADFINLGQWFDKL